MNDDGTTTEIKKEKDMSGKEELLEITYDPQGNIIGRKKADGGRSSVRFKFHELQNYSSYDPMDKYNIYEGGNVYVQTVPTEIVYEPVVNYSIDYNNTNNNLFEHDFGSTGYSLMHNYINNGQMVNLNNNTISNNNTNNTQTINNNSNLNQYFTDNNYNNTYTNQNNNVINTSYNYINSNNSSNTNYNNYINYSSNVNNYQNNQSNFDFPCAKVTKLN